VRNAASRNIQLFFMSIEDIRISATRRRKLHTRDCAAEGTRRWRFAGTARTPSRPANGLSAYDLDVNGIESREIPDNWMRVAAVDPRHTALPPWCSVPCRPAPTHLEVYNEIVVENKDAYALGKAFKQIAGNHTFEAIVIDKKGSQPRPMGRSIGDSTADHYAREFKTRGVQPRRLLGEGSFSATPDTQAREHWPSRECSRPRRCRLHSRRTVLSS